MRYRRPIRPQLRGKRWNTNAMCARSWSARVMRVMVRKSNKAAFAWTAAWPPSKGATWAQQLSLLQKCRESPDSFRRRLRSRFDDAARRPTFVSPKKSVFFAVGSTTVPLGRRTAAKILPRRRIWWSLKPLQRPLVPPATTNDSWVRTPVDAFVLNRLRQNHLTPSPEADRRTLIRRLYFDLHGLPPPSAAVDAFVANPHPQAYERLVEDLFGFAPLR